MTVLDEDMVADGKANGASPKINRRSFIRLTLSAVSASIFLRPDLCAAAPATASSTFMRRRGKETPTVCCYCSVGCGAICTTIDGNIVNIEGDPDHPISAGSLCAKGQAQFNIAYDYKTKSTIVGNSRRNTKVLYRAAGGKEWQEKSWKWAFEKIAARVKQTRDEYLITSKNGVTVNRNEAIALLGGGSLRNEECYLIQKMARALGVVYIDSQIRQGHSSTIAALSATFGLGAMTNNWVDLKNSDVIVDIGGNVAENHPVAMKWVEHAKQNGAKLIHIDPRYTRTSDAADIYAPLRSGTDIAVLGGLINYVIENQKYNKDYVAAYTDAGYLVDEQFSFDSGKFIGFNRAKRNYDKSHWDYQVDQSLPGSPVRADNSLEHKNSVMQILKRHFSRYTPEIVSDITGMPKEEFLKIAGTIAETSARNKASAILYGPGLTQHTNGTQAIRAAAILQLLLGNIGVAGGGINSLANVSNLQGAADMGLDYERLPGYLRTPIAEKHSDLSSYIKAETPTTGALANKSGFMVSLLKALYGDYAASDNDYAFELLPKREDGTDYSQISMFKAMSSGTIKGLFSWGSNPAVSGPRCLHERDALEKLEWLVAVDMFETETAVFWKAPGKSPETIKTEVFLLPAAAHYEKEGSVTNSARLAQWSPQAAKPIGDARSDIWIADSLFKSIEDLYSTVLGKVPECITKLSWDYGPDVPITAKIAYEINGTHVPGGDYIDDYDELRADGSTSCGNWLYAGFHNRGAEDISKQPVMGRDKTDESGIGIFGGWGFSWPDNSRILFNRASADIKGSPHNVKIPLVRWKNSKWEVADSADFPVDHIPSATPAFRFQPDGKAKLFARDIEDGPLPEFYEPIESPVSNLLSTTQSNPTVKTLDISGLAKVGSKEFPVVLTLFKQAEHCQSGSLSRNVPWLAEMAPRMYLEISPELANEKAIADGDPIVVFNNRGAIETKALVTNRLRPLRIGNRVIHQAAAPWQWGFQGIVIGDSTNALTSEVYDENSKTPEFKAFLVDIRKGSK